RTTPWTRTANGIWRAEAESQKPASGAAPSTRATRTTCALPSQVDEKVSAAACNDASPQPSPRAGRGSLQFPPLPARGVDKTARSAGEGSFFITLLDDFALARSGPAK